MIKETTKEDFLNMAKTSKINTVITYLDMEKGSAGYISDRRSDLLSRVDDVDAESVDGISADVVPVHARYQNLALVIVHEQPSNHGWLAPYNTCTKSGYEKN